SLPRLFCNQAGAPRVRTLLNFLFGHKTPLPLVQKSIRPTTPEINPKQTLTTLASIQKQRWLWAIRWIRDIKHEEGTHWHATGANTPSRTPLERPKKLGCFERDGI